MTSASFLHNFESLGDNCEFGFFLQEHGMHETSLFRWAAVVDYEAFIKAFLRGFDGIYRDENLTPRTDTLVLDNGLGGIAFHTDVPIVSRDGKFEFVTSPEERAPIFAQERSKFEYLAEKFKLVLKHEPRIYVVKAEYVEENLSTMKSLLAAMRQFGDASLLYVVLDRSGRKTGTVKRKGKNLYVGYIDRFAGANFPNGANVDAWMKICKSTWDMHTSAQHTLISRIKRALKMDGTPQPEASDAPPVWFDAKHYFMANPDVAESGMDALDHYKRFGRKEGRPLRP